MLEALLSVVEALLLALILIFEALGSISPRCGAAGGHREREHQEGSDMPGMIALHGMTPWAADREIAARVRKVPDS